MDTTQPMNLAVGGNTQTNPALYNGGLSLGRFVSEHSKTISNVIKFLLIIAIVWLAVVMMQNTAADMEMIETNASLVGATAAYMNVMYHQRCKQRGGCSKTCPYISEDDPRVMIYKQLESTDMMHAQIKQGVQEDMDLVSSSLLKVADDAKRVTAATTWNGIVDVESGASQAIGVILNQLKDLDRAFGEVDTIDVPLIDAKNKATALGAAAVIQKNIMVVASLHLNSQIMMQYIMDVPATKQQKIINYDQLVTTAAMSANTGEKSIAQIYAAAIALPTDYMTAYAALAPSATTPSQDILKYMAWMLSQAHASDEAITGVISKLANVSEAYQSCKYVIDRFSNDLPGKMDNDKMTALIQAGDYEGAIIATALESDVVSNHKKFAKERASFESGGGILSVRDDDNDLVPWVGIFGRPTYRRSNGDSMDKNAIADIATDVNKSIPSDKPDSLMRKSSLRLSTVNYGK